MGERYLPVKTVERCERCGGRMFERYTGRGLETELVCVNCSRTLELVRCKVVPTRPGRPPESVRKLH